MLLEQRSGTPLHQGDASLNMASIAGDRKACRFDMRAARILSFSLSSFSQFRSVSMLTQHTIGSTVMGAMLGDATPYTAPLAQAREVLSSCQSALYSPSAPAKSCLYFRTIFEAIACHRQRRPLASSQFSPYRPVHLATCTVLLRAPSIWRGQSDRFNPLWLVGFPCGGPAASGQNSVVRTSTLSVRADV